MPRIVDKLLNPIVGLGAEAYAHHKNKSRSSSPNPQSHNQAPIPPPGYEYTSGCPSDSHGPDYPADFEYENDEEAWELDDAAADVGRSQPSASAQMPKGNWAAPASVDAIANNFLSYHPLQGNQSLGARLAMPIVIPQRRPHDKNRGFVMAYAPILENCGIDQATWMEFMNHFHESLKNSPVFDVVNGAVGVVSMAGNAFPSVTLQVITTVIGVADGIAKECYQRTRTNTFLATMNARFFAPQGMYCLLMTWKPESADVVQTVDLTTTVAKAAWASDNAAADRSFQQKMKTQFKMLKPHHGLSHGDAEIPVAAPLIYPRLDQASEEQKKGWFARGKEFTADYFDRRATAQYLADNPGSTIGSVTQAPQFESQKGDPGNTPKNAGLRSAITGTEGRLGGRLRMRRDARAERLDYRRKNQGGIRGAAKQITKGNRPTDVVKRVLHPDVIYLMVVRMPSQEEMAAAMRALEDK